MSLGYIGSKKSLISFIESSLSNHIDLNKNYIFGDLFAGTSIIGNYFNNKYKYSIISNDLEYYSYIISYAKLKSLYSDKLGLIIKKINNNEYEVIDNNDQYLIRNQFTPYNECERMFFTVSNGIKIDYSMNVIKQLFNEEIINIDEKIFLEASLVCSLDKVSNTSSVYGSYLKKFKKPALKDIIITPIHTNTSINHYIDNIVYNKDILELNTKTDILYLDPPYNNRQYSSNYSLLNYILKYDKDIEIIGKTGIIKNWNRSKFCSKQTINESLHSILKNNKTSFLLLSYNNEGLLSKDILISIIENYYNDITLYEYEYKKFKSNSLNLDNKKTTIEYLFICSNK